MLKAFCAFRHNWYSLPVVALFVSFDQLTKMVAAEKLRTARPQYYLHNLLWMQYTQNSGSDFGLGADFPPAVRFWLFTVFLGLILVGLEVYLLSSKLRTFNVVAFSLVIAGGTGNVLDRIIHGGGVVDFMSVGLGFLNVADLTLGLGLILLIIGNIGKETHQFKKGALD